MPNHDMHLLPLQRSDVPAAGRLLGHAFADDPVVCYYFSSNANVVPLSISLMTAAASLAVAYGTAFGLVEEERLRAVALLLPPSRKEFPLRGVIREILKRPSLWRFGPIARYFGVEDSLTPHRPKGGCWTLMTLGVEVSHQRKGYGSRLLQGVLHHAVGSTIFLETYRASNLRFYEKHGFERAATLNVHGGRGPQCWTMRLPASVPADER